MKEIIAFIDSGGLFHADIELVLMLILTIMLLLCKKNIEKTYKSPRHKRTSYKYVLLLNIFWKTAIPVPLIFWFLDTCSKCFLKFNSPFDIGGAAVSWGLYCAAIVVYRSLFRSKGKKNARNKSFPFIDS